jgi:Collagen triple helix repeat (20 copies)/IPT/TIG domain
MTRYFLFPLFLLTPVLAMSQQTSLPLISDVLDNAAGTQITIQGQGFGTSKPLVTLSGQSLTVVASSDTSVVATVPSTFTPGTYVVSVQNSATRLLALLPAEIGPADGVTGATGPAGPQGPQGAAGPVGATGAQGATGARGPAGPAGATGPVGAVGPVGPIGAAGAPGPAGLAGAPGAIGPVGLQGATGTTGPAGVQGQSGPQGITGPVGNQGAAGLPIYNFASNILITSTLNLSAPPTLFNGSVLGETNSVYTAGDTSTVPASVELGIPVGCTASNFQASVIGSVSEYSSGLAGPDLAQLEVNGSPALSCPITPHASVSCSSSASYPIAAGSLVSVSLLSGNPGNYGNANVLINFSCQ